MAYYEVTYKRWAYKQIVVEANDEDEANSIAHEWDGMIDWNDDDDYETGVNIICPMSHKERCDYDQRVIEGHEEKPKRRLSRTLEERESEVTRSKLRGFKQP